MQKLSNSGRNSCTILSPNNENVMVFSKTNLSTPHKNGAIAKKQTTVTLNEVAHSPLTKRDNYVAQQATQVSAKNLTGGGEKRRHLKTTSQHSASSTPGNLIQLNKQSSQNNMKPSQTNMFTNLVSNAMTKKSGGNRKSNVNSQSMDLGNHSMVTKLNTTNSR